MKREFEKTGQKFVYGKLLPALRDGGNLNKTVFTPGGRSGKREGSEGRGAQLTCHSGGDFKG